MGLLSEGMRAMKTSETGFQDRLKGSVHAVFVVAKWLHRKGYDVRIPAETGVIDLGDIFANKPDTPVKRIEVKGRNVVFTNASDWPYEDMLVSNEAAVNRALADDPHYVILNAAMTHAALILPDTKQHWKVIKKWASNTCKEESFYACPIEHVKFIRIDIEGE
jgi:hypothetical protein